MPSKSPRDASAAAAEILAAVSVLESDAAAAAANLQQLISHLNDHTQRCTILSLPHAGVIKEAAAASSFYSHQSSQAILDFIARHSPLLFSTRTFVPPPLPFYLLSFTPKSASFASISAPTHSHSATRSY
jgi:hypothetical protein